MIAQDKWRESNKLRTLRSPLLVSRDSRGSNCGEMQALIKKVSPSLQPLIDLDKRGSILDGSNSTDQAFCGVGATKDLL